MNAAGRGWTLLDAGKFCLGETAAHPQGDELAIGADDFCCHIRILFRKDVRV